MPLQLGTPNSMSRVRVKPITAASTSRTTSRPGSSMPTTDEATASASAMKSSSPSIRTDLPTSAPISSIYATRLSLASTVEWAWSRRGSAGGAPLSSSSSRLRAVAKACERAIPDPEHAAHVEATPPADPSRDASSRPIGVRWEGRRRSTRPRRLSSPQMATTIGTGRPERRLSVRAGGAPRRWICRSTSSTPRAPSRRPTASATSARWRLSAGATRRSSA